ncbi:sec1 family domain-containing protein 1-like [Acanthaster planci]|uniref:Sec1 family domain-containing protein 1-like n=1 Tax=Acanthaster planci TaxID=133434 RepID=A0A8B7YWI5_ACAPL|nr:sec1 family domain-containing protein 1-like [Acanthaster planci]XP_022095657.1 sec1 family domain-containing protein 1-like [Acanthaster planci]
MAATNSTVRDKQIAALKRMLNLNLPVTKTSLNEPTWKVLVYDRFGQDIISPLLSVRELRDMGVTLHLLLHSDRDPIPDVPAVYFVLPTEENVQRICRDCQSQLYEAFYLNFISAISRQLLEELAGAALQSNTVSQISKVFDQYLNFISMEDFFFTVRHQNRDTISYYSMNNAYVKDTEMDAIMDTITASLFSVCVTLGTVPIIRCPKGNAAEMVAEKLDKKLRENLRDSRNSLFTTDSMQAGQFSFQRPLLVILDRNMDLATPLHHTWTYQALAHDVLDLQLNRVVIEETVDVGHSTTGSRPKKKTKSYDLSCHDKFWSGQKGNPFPEVAEAVQSELETYRASEDEVKKLKAAMGLEGEDEGAISMLSDNTAKLTSAVSSLPELLQKKKTIDMHTNVATALLDQIKARKLDVYFELEEKLMSKQSLDKSLMDVITDPDAGTPDDKMRLFIIFFICTPTMSDSELDQYSVALESAGCNLSPLQYVKRWKHYTKMTAPSQYAGGGTKTISMFSKLMSTGSQFVMEGVKNFVVKKHNLPATRIVDALMELKSNQETDDYRYFDPKLLRVTDSSAIPRNKTPFQDAIVFVVGGGNYIEYQNLIDYVKSKSSTAGSGKKITYGCSELFNADQFLKQLTQLGQEKV